MWLFTWPVVVFWLVLYFSYSAYFAFERRLQANGKYGSVSGLLLVACATIILSTSVYIVTYWCWGHIYEERAKIEFYGNPITTQVQNLEGKIFTPQAFVVTNQHILLYDKDGKVYALDGIMLDNLKPEQLTVADSTSYAVYRKGDQVFFGKN